MIAIIPARGGSKGLPNKNIKPLLSKPLIAYTIEAALKAESVNDVIVSTDSEEIAAIAKQYGASIPFLRPSSLATDESIAIDTYLYTINRLQEESSVELENIMVLLPTCPLRNSNDIDAAAELFFEKKADSVISYTQEHHPIYWHKQVDENLRFVNLFDDLLKNRQELKPTYYPNGAIYIFRKSLLQERRYFSEKSYAYIMPRVRSVDIDTIDDFEYTEYLMKKA
ncbi:acylneuraminate cytidylyltransferase family protein [uncultured Pontibacter sp.]|uniref:acylneuraminate cytidylyltransferase family protein n=1 Tax=uncultured Pontibacter sp. TaxID=453356 RepID=UPI002633CC7C|nr:acylneuraminate cytidylyltransferase family protein [uncultured Pontibacter sp.]